MNSSMEGAEELIKKLDSIADTEKLKQSIGRGCEIVIRSAITKAPKDTGALRRSIQRKIEVVGSDVVGTVYTPLEYAPYIEYGTGLFAEGGNGRKDVPWNYQDDNGHWHSTSGIKPHPFLRPALEENKKEIVEEISKNLKEGL